MVRVTLPRMEKKETKVIEKSELQWFVGAADGHDWLYALLLLDMSTGCRRGELLALTWPDIDFDLFSLTISKALAQTRAKGVFLKVPKGRKSRKFSLPRSGL